MRCIKILIHAMNRVMYSTFFSQLQTALCKFFVLIVCFTNLPVHCYLIKTHSKFLKCCRNPLLRLQIFTLLQCRILLKINKKFQLALFFQTSNSCAKNQILCRYGAKQKSSLKRVPPELICKDGFSVHLTFCDYNNSTLKVVSYIRTVFVI